MTIDLVSSVVDSFRKSVVTVEKKIGTNEAISTVKEVVDNNRQLND
jgi:hypothetical protein